MNTRDRQRSTFSARLDAHETAIPGYRRLWQRIEQRVLTLGGELVVVTPWPEDDLELLAAHGAPHPAPARLEPGARRDCHANAARRWISGDETIWTGYALSADGLWRQHSWTADTDGIVETTETRTGYWGAAVPDPFGFAFNALGADGFRAALRTCPDPGRRTGLRRQIPPGL